MKLFIASDIHGSEYYCAKMLEAFDREGADTLVILGDILYHGPRNDLPRDYLPKAVAAMLNARKEAILAVRGNCDGEVDQMVLDFPILAENCIYVEDGCRIFFTHGHKLSLDNPPALRKGDAFIFGHTHIPFFEERGVIKYMNPGSVSIPKNGSSHGYMTAEKGLFLWKTLEGKPVDIGGK